MVTLKEFKRHENESEEDFQFRVCGMKEMANLTWEDITVILNNELGYNYTESRYRKQYSAYIKGYLDRDEEIKPCAEDCAEDYEDDCEEEELSSEARNLIRKRIEFEKEKVKLSTLRLDTNRIVRESARRELFYEEVIRAIGSIDWKKGYNFSPLKKQKDNEEYVLAFADVHFGKDFKSITNAYSIQEVYDRFNNLLGDIEQLVEEYSIGTLHICALGDLLEGFYLRVSQIQGVKIGLIDQLIHFQKFLLDWIDKISEFVCVKYYTVLSSNHGQTRPFGSKSNEFVLEDVERVLFAFLTERFKDSDRVQIFKTEEKYTMFDLLGYEIILFHGHEFKDLKSILQKLSWKYKKFFDYALTAHKHEGGEIVCGEGASGKNNCSVIKVPAIMGTDDYADSLLLGSKAGASLIKFTQSQGKRFVEDLILN